MTSQNFSYSRIIAVWLVVIAFLCGMIVPSLALANVEISLGSEGDPDDGLDFSGGGGGGLDNSNNLEAVKPDLPQKIAFSLGFPEEYRSFNNPIFTIWFDSRTGIFLVLPSTEFQTWRANR